MQRSPQPYTPPRSPKRRQSRRKNARRGVPPPASPQAARQPRRKKPRMRPKTLLMLGAGLSLLLVGLCVVSLLAGVGLLYAADRILPGVSSVGVSLGSLDEAEAADKLAAAWVDSGLLLRDGDRSWEVNPADLGIGLDAATTAAAASEWGRSEGGIPGALRAILSGVEIDPALTVDLNQIAVFLESARSYVDVPAGNAGVELVNGQAVATPASEGRALNISATIELMRIDAAGELADGALNLVMDVVYPAVTDSSPLVAQANALLSSPFNVDAYDPIRDEWLHWTAPPEMWAAWLTAAPDPGSPTGLALTMNTAGPSAFLQASGSFADERTLRLDDAVVTMQDALARGQTSTVIRVWHNTTTYAVRPGQTLASIAEEVGIPYPYIQAENPGVNTDALSVGQTLTLPSKDVLVPLEPVPHKRIIVSRSQQHLWAYESGQVVFDWVISTGLPSSPTALGTFQVQTHELNAYADQWNLYMPHFMGFYHPGPNMDLMNGFHGFPTRGGGYLLWSGDLGHPVTYGCVLLSLENAEALYNWAEDGVVVEVRG
ncbi:MAG: L,D-transpeptidase family protein [Anaerolineae bacterium]|nr:L,D-transpeptidase family protein [Anaerolineae bacterium]